MVITPDLHPGYRLGRPRGIGGFGEVWEAENEMGAAVALKFMRCRQNRGAAQELRSVQVVKKLAHAHLIRIDRVWCANEYLVVAMELADASLADLFEIYRTDVGTPLAPKDVLPFLAQAASALDFLNNRQHRVQGRWVTIQHCDVTPRNLLLFGDSVKLSDFGLTTTLTARQKVHHRAGTPGYAAPEVFQGLVSDRTDQYALAACYCLLRGGRLPFADAPADFQTGYVPPNPDLSMLPPLERPPIARALAIPPQDRWPSCCTLVTELQKVTSAALADDCSGRVKRCNQVGATPYGVGCEVRATLGNQAAEVRIIP